MEIHTNAVINDFYGQEALWYLLINTEPEPMQLNRHKGCMHIGSIPYQIKLQTTQDTSLCKGTSWGDTHSSEPIQLPQGFMHKIRQYSLRVVNR